MRKVSGKRRERRGALGACCSWRRASSARREEKRRGEERSSGASRAVALHSRVCLQDVRAAPWNPNDRLNVKQRDAPTRNVAKTFLYQERRHERKRKSASLNVDVPAAFTHSRWSARSRSRCIFCAPVYLRFNTRRRSFGSKMMTG